eukprot:g3885.t1
MYINGFMMNVIEPGNNVLINEETYQEDMHEATPKTFVNDLCNLCMSDIVPGNQVDQMLAKDECMELGLMLITERPSTVLNCEKGEDKEKVEAKLVKNECKKTPVVVPVVKNASLEDQLKNTSDHVSRICDVLAKTRSTVEESEGLLANSIFDNSYPTKQVYATFEPLVKNEDKEIMLLSDGETKRRIERRENAKRRGVMNRMVRAISKLNAFGKKTDTFTLELDFVEVDKHSKVKKDYEEDFDFGSITYRTALKLVRTRNDSSPIRFGDMVDYV